MDAWFTNRAIGKHTIGRIVKDMCEKAGVTSRKVNHSTRTTGIAFDQIKSAASYNFVWHVGEAFLINILVIVSNHGSLPVL